MCNFRRDDDPNPTQIYRYNNRKESRHRRTASTKTDLSKLRTTNKVEEVQLDFLTLKMKKLESNVSYFGFSPNPSQRNIVPHTK